MHDRLAPESPLARSARDDLLSTSSEELRVSSPPYRPVASSSHLNINFVPEDLPPSPAYTKVHHEMPHERAGFLHHTVKSLDDDPEPRPDGYDTKSSRPTVHYTDDLHRGMPPAPGYTRTDSGTDFISSRPSSIAATDDEDSDDYDWSGEEDLVDEEAKFEERMGGGKTKRKGWGPKRIITILFSTIIGSTFLAGVLVTPGVLIQVYWYKPHPSEHRLFVKDNVQAWLFWAAANLVISWYLAMIVDVAPVLVQFFISVAWGHVSEYVKTRIEMYDSIKNNIKPLLYAASGWASWIIIFGHIYKLYDTEHPTESRAAYTHRLQQAVEFLFFFGLMICIKQMLSHFIAFSFHRTAYKDRVEEVHSTLAAIETLRQYRPTRPTNARKSPGTRTPLFGSMGFSSPMSMSDKEHFASLNSALRSATPPGPRSQFDHDDGVDADTEDPDRTLVAKGKRKERLSWLQGHKHKSEKASDSSVLPNAEYEMEACPLSPGIATPPSTYYGDTSSPYRYPPTPAPQPTAEATLSHAAKVLKNAVLHDARNIGGKNEGDGSMAWNVSSTQEAKRLARAIYIRFKDRGRTYLLPSDFRPAFPTPEAAEAAFRVFDKDNNGDISRAEIKRTLVKVYKERRFLARSMRDVGAALKTLDNIILVFAMIVLFFISLSVFGVEVGDSLTSVYSIGIAASFIFKNAASSAFDAIMFLFVTHPYDTGDRCFIDEEVIVVKKVGLFATVFTRADGSETYYFNSQLFSKFITNVRRSGKTFENLTLQVAWRTPLTKIDALEKSLNDWLSTEEKRWFEPTTSIVLQHIEFQRYLILTIGIAHNGYKLADWGLRWERKTAFHAAVLHYCRQLDITCYESPIPITYGVPDLNNTRASPPASPAVFDDGPTSPELEEAHPLKQTLGFLPPPAVRLAHLTRARKSRSKKSAMRGMDG